MTGDTHTLVLGIPQVLNSTCWTQTPNAQRMLRLLPSHSAARIEVNAEEWIKGEPNEELVQIIKASARKKARKSWLNA